MKQLACGSVVPNCEAVFRGESEDDLMRQATAHAQEAHGMDTIPPAVAAQVRAQIQDV